MLAARDFLHRANVDGGLHQSDRVTCDLYGSLALTGKGHGTDTAVIVGLAAPRRRLSSACHCRRHPLRNSLAQVRARCARSCWVGGGR